MEFVSLFTTVMKYGILIGGIIILLALFIYMFRLLFKEKIGFKEAYQIIKKQIPDKEEPKKETKEIPKEIKEDKETKTKPTINIPEINSEGKVVNKPIDVLDVK